MRRKFPNKWNVYIIFGFLAIFYFSWFLSCIHFLLFQFCFSLLIIVCMQFRKCSIKWVSVYLRIGFRFDVSYYPIPISHTVKLYISYEFSTHILSAIVFCSIEINQTDIKYSKMWNKPMMRINVNGEQRVCFSVLLIFVRK